MKQVLLLSTLLALGVCAYLLVPTIAQAQSGTCTVNCPGGSTLRCCLSSGTCSSVPGSSINCNGTTLSCGPADAHRACLDQCWVAANECSADCASKPIVQICLGVCNYFYNQCISECGMPPVTNIGC